MLALGACSPAPHAAAPRHYPTVVSLNPCTDAILAEVADPQQILAISAYSHNAASSSMDLAVARRFRKTSGAVEEVLALRPDLVVTSTFMPPATRSAMTGLGLSLEEVPIASTVSESIAQVRRLAAITGHPERGEALVSRIELALADAAAPAGWQPIQTVVWESGGIVPGDNTLIAELLRHAGFTNFSAAKGMRQADLLPLERMLADPPKLILVAGNPRSGEDRQLTHPALAALKNARRERLDPALLYCGGPTIIRAAERLAQVRASTSSARAGTVENSRSPLRLSLSKPARNSGPTL